MAAELEALRRELTHPLPHPDMRQLRDFARLVIECVLHHHDTLPQQLIGNNPTRRELEKLLGAPAPERGEDFAKVLAEYEEKIAPNAFRTNHPRFLAFIPGVPNWYSILGDMLCAGKNFFAGVWLEGAAPAQVELTVLRWFRDILGMPKQTAGLLTSGGSEANLIALVTAREPIPPVQRPRLVLYLTQQRHTSLDRAAKIIGLCAEQIRLAPVDDQFRLDPVQLRQIIRQDKEDGWLPWVLAANAGSTNTGTVDPLDAVADICQEQEMWLHADAAYGWSALLVPEERPAFKGIERAHSITLDPHKWFAQTFESGCVLVRDGLLLPATFTSHPDYLQDVLPDEEEVNFADYGIALTRRFRALRIWLSVKALGLSWYRDLITRGCRLADFAQLLLERSGRFEILCPRQLSIVCFRYIPPGAMPTGDELDRLNLGLVEALRQTGRAFLSSTRLNGRVALRLCFVNWRTTAVDVEEVIGLLKTLGEKLSS
jgi:glutamate/tyrosine decarboxylase-like PLP-dependent enzyme